MTRRVLIADDEPAITEMIAIMLAHEGFEPVTAHTALDAIKAAQEAPPAAILMDVMMPYLDGRAACRLLKQDVGLVDVPIVLFSSADEIDVDWRGAGAVGFLQKPVDLRTLPGFVARLVADASRVGTS